MANFSPYHHIDFYIDPTLPTIQMTQIIHLHKFGFKMTQFLSQANNICVKKFQLAHPMEVHQHISNTAER